jgi:DNA polymerase
VDERQARAWAALDLGPLWIRRHAPAHDVAEAIDDAGKDAVHPVAAAAVRAGQGSLPGSQAIDQGPASSAPDPASLDRPPSDWSGLREAVAQCRLCGLCETRTQTVFGVGDTRARWMFVGEAPGAEEDARGEPFVGQAGKLLDAMLAAVGTGRQADVFIANVLKCRPPNNRNPEPDEVARCEPYLQRQIELVSPRVVVAMGRFAAQSLLRTDATIATLRGKVHRYGVGDRDVRLVVTYHPAYLLRNPADKSKAWADLCLAMDCLVDGN